MTKRMNSKMNRVYTKVVHKRKPFYALHVLDVQQKALELTKSRMQVPRSATLAAKGIAEKLLDKEQ